VKKVLWIFTALLMALALVLASCAPAATTTPPTTTPPTTTPPTTTPPTTTPPTGPQYGGHLRVAYTLEASSLDPHVGVSGGDAYYWQQMFDQLVGSDSSLVPQAYRSLAESWEFPTPTTMLFHLRKGVKFHDGTEFNADAVKFNIERVLDPVLRATPRGSFLVIDRVEVVDKNTAKFHLKNPWGAGLSMLADRGGAMNSPTAVQKLGKEYGFKPSGTGPFKLFDYVAASSCTMVKNEEYWGKDAAGNRLPYPDKLTLLIIPDETVMSAALETGQIDLGGVPLKDIKKFQANPNITVVSYEGSSIASMLYFNLAKPPMDNINLRKAVAYAINPQAINEAVYYGTQIIAKGGFWPPRCWVFDDTVPRPSYDVAKAKEFLKLGGMPNGFKMDVITWGATHTQAAEMGKAMLAEVGIDITLKIYDVGTATSKFFAGQESPLFWTSWSRYPEPDWLAGLAYKSDGYYNPGKLTRADVDALVAKGAASYDIKERQATYRQIQEIVLGEVWTIPTLYGVGYVGYWKDRVGGLENFYGWDAKWQLRYLWRKS